MIEYPPPVRQLLLLLSLAVPASARASSMTPEMDRLLLDGIDAIYRMDFAAADAISAQAISLAPGYPHAYLGQAAADLIRFSYATDQTDAGLIKSFEAKIARTIEVAQAWLKTHPDDPDALLVLGSAHGISGRMAIVRRQWLTAFRHGRAAMKFIRAAIKADPEQHDAVLGLGMFDYYVDTIPRFAGWLAKIMLGGDRARGLAEIKLAAEKGRYTKTAAQLILVEIYTEDKFGGRDPAEALRLMRDIHALYPDSSMLHSAYIVTLYEDGRMVEALREAQEYKALVEAGRYPATTRSMVHALLGTLLWAAGDKVLALEEFQTGAKAKSGVKDRWAVWSRARAGQLLDALGRRAEALEAYRAAYREPDHWDYRALIKPCLARPCVGAEYPGHFSPDR